MTIKVKGQSRKVKVPVKRNLLIWNVEEDTIFAFRELAKKYGHTQPAMLKLLIKLEHINQDKSS